MLTTKLKQQLESIQVLQKILEDEQTCLKEKKFSALNDILFQKQSSLQKIADLDKMLSVTTAQDEISSDENLRALKNKVDGQLQQCQKINDVNGRLVELSMKSNKHLMQLMKQATGKNSITYDQKGMLNSGTLLGKDIKA